VTARVPTLLSVAGITDVGLIRSLNEDTFRVSEIGGTRRWGPRELIEHLSSEGGFALGVYDGAGGHGGGDAASETAARTLG
jgi:serine/threonine protein phosphatase PrpC